VQCSSSTDLDRAYSDLECLAEAAGMIRAHGIGTQYRAHLAYLMRYAAESACSALERAEQSMNLADITSLTNSWAMDARS
jgi:hypothetical protein